MRVISGTAGGIHLQTPKGEVRPTTDRVKEALFSILGERVKGADVLDLFAGSGSLGIESLSRGCRSARLVEASRAACDMIRKNLEKTRLKAHLVNGDAPAFAVREAETAMKYDIVFADPPYCKGPADRDYLAELLVGNFHKILKKDGIFVAEAESGWGITRPEYILPEPWKLLTVREYGKNTLLFFQVVE